MTPQYTPEQLALYAAHHELTTLHGLYAHDGHPLEDFQIDTSAVLAQIEAVLPPGPGPWLPATQPPLEEDTPG